MVDGGYNIVVGTALSPVQLIDGTIEEYSNSTMTIIYRYTFAGCSSLTSVSFPACTSIGSNAFYNCTRLTSVNFPVCTSIGYSDFSGCTSLTSLTLGASTVCTLNNINAFYITPMSNSTYTGTFGSIYVPASLVDAYKSATNLATYSDRIGGINGINSYNDLSLLYNSSHTVQISMYFDIQPTDISVISDNNNIVSVSNINYTSTTISFDITTHDQIIKMLLYQLMQLQMARFIVHRLL